MSFTFAPIQSIVMGAMIALTDVLLRPGLGNKGSIESLFLYVAQTFILYIVFKFQGSGLGCSPSEKLGDGNFDFGRMMMKVGLGTMVMFITDMILRPEHIANLWIQFIKFVIQGSIMWHVFNADFTGR